jgi:hypothetical protein
VTVVIIDHTTANFFLANDRFRLADEPSSNDDVAPPMLQPTHRTNRRDDRPRFEAHATAIIDTVCQG